MWGGGNFHVWSGGNPCVWSRGDFGVRLPLNLIWRCFRSGSTGKILCWTVRYSVQGVLSTDGLMIHLDAAMSNLRDDRHIHHDPHPRKTSPEH